MSENTRPMTTEELIAEIKNLKTVMMAAAVEISEHWDAHCDEEGYGPANLVRRLENGYPEQYGYDAQTVVRLDKERNALKAKLSKYSTEPVAYITETTQGPMVWTPEMYSEACTYCDDDEFPVPLYTKVELCAPPCIGKDPLCPCQDGDACHYKDSGETKAMRSPYTKEQV